MSADELAASITSLARTGQPLGLCVDLNVWIAYFISLKHPRQGSATAFLVAAARSGRCALGPTQLVVSWGMLTRLRMVLLRRTRMSHAAVDDALEEIAAAAEAGPFALSPLVILGGTGVVPLTDEEDAHVLEAAVAGRAHLIATANFDDFVSYRTEIVAPGRVAIHRTGDHEMIIAHPVEVARWLRTGVVDLG